MNRIEFKNITTLDKDKNKFVKLIKNFNCSFDSGKIISFISEDYQSKKILSGLLTENIKPAQGQMLIPEKSHTSLISDNTISEAKKGLVIGSSFLMENFKNNKSISKKLLNEKRTLEKEIFDITNNISKVDKTSGITHSENMYIVEKWLSLFSDEIVNIDKENLKFASIAKSIKKLEYELDHVYKSRKKEKKNIDNYFSSKEISILEFNENQILNIKKYKFLEFKEVKNLRNKHRATDDQQKEIYAKLKLQSQHIIKYLKNLKIHGFQLSESEFRPILKLNSIKDEKAWLIQFDKLIDFLYKLKLSVNEEVKKDLNSIILYVANIQNYRSPVNSVAFNEIYRQTIKDIESKLVYFDKTVMNIEELIILIIKKDKEEEKFQRRKLWEFQIVSLRFQKQIYNEKHVVVMNFLSSIREEFFKHTPENINDFYIELKKYERAMLEIDLSLNNWRFLRELKELDLNIKIKKEELIFKIGKSKTELSELIFTPVKLRSKKIHSLINYYENLSEKEKNKDKVFSKYAEGILKISKILKKDLNSKKKSFVEMNILINRLSEEEKENEMLQLLEEISFDLEIIGNEISEMTKGDIQRLLIVSSLMNGSKIIVIDEPQIDINSSAKSSVQNTIKTLSKKYGTTFILLTRNLKSALEYSDIIAFVERGTVWEYGSPKSIITNNMHPISKDLIDNAGKISFLKEETQIINFDQKNLLHNQFLLLREHKVSKDHYIFCSDEEFEKWGDK